MTAALQQAMLEYGQAMLDYGQAILRCGVRLPLYREDWTADAEFIADARTAMPKMRAALEAVLALHPWECLECEGIDLDASPRCGHCYEPWPCPTVVLIREALT